MGIARSYCYESPKPTDGDLILSPVADPPSIRRMGIEPGRLPNVGAFSQGQRRFLDYHRDNVLRMARR